MHKLKFPFSADYDHPEKYGLAPFKSVNLHIHTPDNETLGAWFTVSERFYRSRPAGTPLAEDDITSALTQHPTILFFHGNAATRALHKRIAYYKAYSARLGANTLALDYRGFADSTGTPSEEGLALDARAAWDWLAQRGAKPEDVLVVGNSLGTAVSVMLVSDLEKDGVQPRGMVLLAPFSSVDTLLETYHLLGLVPLFSPLKAFPLAVGYVKHFIVHHFDTLSRITTLRTPILIVHSEDDWDIPFTHSETLFSAIMEPHLSVLDLPAGPTWAHTDEVERLHTVLEERAVTRSKLVERREIEQLGLVEVFARNTTGDDVVFLKTQWGGHDRVGLLEGVQDLMGQLFNLH
ncbi:hypothetical protein EWM64_g3633 [Hericium alpestre]|uniref:AB hydrolase-1 domain-containing protein n=1 Tax=Hericium alpestre TaxID=135208 RepID=A0A4Z0A223_9AGAM|nr:hypothetical protein EWM64_g3633 [Hericium alpestre]